MDYRTITITDQGTIRTITIHRPERRNAITPEMVRELIAALEETATATARVLVLMGAGDAFCSGLDISVLREMSGKSAIEYRTDAELIARLFMALYELPIPTVAAVQGPAIAGGAGLAIICDFTLATREARFGFTEARIGFVPALVSAFLNLLIGGKHARDLLLTGRIIEADEAQRMGLVNEVVDRAKLAERVQELADVLLANSPQSLEATKRSLVAQNKGWLDDAVSAALEAHAQSRLTADFEEGVAAFIEKRKPQWKDR